MQNKKNYNSFRFIQNKCIGNYKTNRIAICKRRQNCRVVREIKKKINFTRPNKMYVKMFFPEIVNQTHIRCNAIELRVRVCVRV